MMNKTKTYSKDSMLRRFSKMVMDEEIVDEVKNRMFYKSPSEIRKEALKHRGQKRRRPMMKTFNTRPKA